MTPTCSERSWAHATFSRLEGDTRWGRRLVHLAMLTALRPAGQVTRVCATAADREGAFRLLENKRIKASAIGAACYDACAWQCAGEDIFVAIDGSSLSFTDRKRVRGLGGVGNWKARRRGIHVASALAIDRCGVPIGLCGQTYWTRTKRAKPVKAHRAMQTETRYGVELLKETDARLRAHGANPWYQLDRGFDVWPILQLGCREKMRITVRAVGTRKVLDHANERRPLRQVLHESPSLGTYTVDLPAQYGRSARRAEMEVRVATVRVPLKVGKKRRELVELQVVRAVELGPLRKPLEWILFTTVPVKSFADARSVLHAYTMRWRIEEFHRTWKRGLCNVEDSQLRSVEAVTKWAIILAAVAVRANRLTRLRDTDPNVPATTEFSRLELDAIVLLRRPKGVALGYTPSLVTAIRWVADLGGYTGKSSGGPPGPAVIGRGLEQIDTLARGLANLEQMRSG
jgi:nucleotide-binding universal stress UspA family protein